MIQCQIWRRMDIIRRRIQSQIDSCITQISSDQHAIKIAGFRALRRLLVHFSDTEAILFQALQMDDRCEGKVQNGNTIKII